MIVVDGVELVSHSEAAALLGIAPKTLSNRFWMGRAGFIPAYRIGMNAFYIRSEVEAAAAKEAAAAQPAE